MIVAIIQARMGSTRLPGKVMIDIAGKPALGRVIERVAKSKYVDKIVVATTHNANDGIIVDYAMSQGVTPFLGREEDVMGRVLEAGTMTGADIIVDITADCPLIDPAIIDNVIWKYTDSPIIGNVKWEWLNRHKKPDYVSNCVPIKSFPDGMDVQVYHIEALKQVYKLTANSLRKHVGWNIPQWKQFYCIYIEAEPELHWPELRLTLDTKEDYHFITSIFNHFGNQEFGIRDIIATLRENPDKLPIINADVRTKLPEEG